MEDKLKQIRRLINQPRRQNNLIKDLPCWNQLCASLDAIEDTKLAINSYVAIESGNDKGQLYLLVYGVLQALFLQQDAVNNLCEALAIPVERSKYPRLQEIRKIRNESIGHPTKRNQSKGKHSYHYISRISLTLKGFDLLTYFHDGKFESKYISIEECITDQDKYLKDILSAVIENLKREERAHKEKFMREKLIDCFPNIHYHLEKIYEAANSDTPERRIMALVHIEWLQKAIGTFESSLAKRGIELETYDEIRYEFEFTKYPLDKLCKHFKCLKEGKTSSMTHLDIRVYSDSLKQHISELMDTAKSIDEDYADLGDE